MTKDVVVTIKGFQTADEDEDTIEMVHIGEYYERDGTHYILFDELMEGISAPVKNRIKIKGHRLEVQKKGPVSATMVFEENKSQSSTYAIPYGSFLLETCTTSVQVQEEDGKLAATASYELSVNGVHCARNDIHVTVQPRGSFKL